MHINNNELVPYIMAVILSESIGYLVMIGIGLAMAAVVTLMVKAETKWLGTRKTSEWFYTAGRTIKTGLIASSIVSAWTWAATLLQSSTVTFEFGMAGSFWYAAGASIQVILFSIIAIELKRKAPMTHTFPEMMYVRYGRHSHKVFLFFALLTNTIVTAMLVLGGAAVVNALTGVDIMLAAFLLPVGIVLYTVFGGLKATFFAEYINTCIIFCVVLVFVSTIYFASPEIGGIQGMYDKLTVAATLTPVDGNVAGSFLTMASAGALVFGVINIIGNFGTVFVDQSYWQRAIAARSRSVGAGFIVGGLAWFAIPFTMATTLGLAAVAIGVDLTEDQIGLGLVAPTAAALLMGDVGAILILTVVFTAVTAAGASQIISVSSLVTYDVYRTYANPSATGRQLMRVSRYVVLIFGMGMGVLASGLFQLGLSLQYVYLMMGILIGSAVAPISLAILWDRIGKYTAVSGAITGLAAGVTGWLTVSYAMYGEITVQSTGSIYPMLLGNVLSITTSLAVCMIGSIASRERFDFRTLKQKIIIIDDRIRSTLQKKKNDRMLAKASSTYKKIGMTAAIILPVVWPVPLYVSGYVFTQDAFLVWVWLAVVWAAGAAITVVILPLLEARHSIHTILFRTRVVQTDVISEPRSDTTTSAVRVLVAVDGSVVSLRAISEMHHLLRDVSSIRLYLLHVLEWPHDDEDNIDTVMSSRMQKEGNLLLRSVVVPREAGDVIRIVKLGDPPARIVEIADKLNVDMVAMGRRGLGGTDEVLGHVTRQVLRSTRRPVILLD